MKLSVDNDPGVLPLWRTPAVLRLLIIALLAETAYAILNISTMPVYLKMDRAFGEDVVGFVVVAFLLSEAIFKGPMGKLADRVGHRRLIVIGPSLTIATSMLTLLVPRHFGYAESGLIMILRMVDGLGAAMLWPAAFALMGDLVPSDRRQEAMSYLNTCYLLGIALALPIGGLCNDLLGDYVGRTIGAHSPSIVLAAVMFALASITGLRVLPHDQPAKTESAHEPSSELHGLSSAIRTIPQFLVMGFVTFMGIGFPMVIVKLFAWDEFHLSESAFGFLALPGALAMAGLSVPMSKLAEQIGKARAVHLGLGLCAIGLTWIALGAWVLPLRTAFALALGGLPIGIGFLIAIPAWYASVSELDPSCRAQNLGAVMAAQGFGAIVAAPIGSAAYRYVAAYNSHLGHYCPFVLCACCVAFAWMLSLRIIHDQPSVIEHPIPNIEPNETVSS